ncbi:MAG TPA: PAS domain S-box protein [Gaiellaceae bacterium]|nr:PAS domain S-box protein [Gaiellaceae bacterium]
MGERALREGRAYDLVQQTLLGEAASGMLAALFVFGEDGEMVAVNEAACSLTGWTREELLAHHADVLAENPAQAAKLRRELLASRPLVGSGSLRTKSGEMLASTYIASLTRVAGTAFIVVVAVVAPARRAAPRGRAAKSAAA